MIKRPGRARRLQGAIWAVVCVMAGVMVPAAPAHAVPEGWTTGELKLFWHAARGDHASAQHYTTRNRLTDEGYVEVTRYGDQGWLYWDSPYSHPADAVKLNQWFHAGRGDYFSTATADGDRDARSAGYQLLGAEGRVMTTRRAYTVPLKLFWHAGRADNMTVSTPAAEAAASSAGYRYVRIEGYVYSATNICSQRPASIRGAGTLTGTDGTDVIIGSAGADIINAKGGNDYVCGGGGNDRIEGGAGNDSLSVPSGTNYLSGGDDNDKLFGGSGPDDMFGGGGNDTLIGNEGDDELFGNFGDDTLVGSQGHDECTGHAGTDIYKYCELVLGEPSGRDLFVSDTWRSPSSPAAGQAFTIYFSYCNAGAEATGAFTLRIERDGGVAATNLSRPAQAANTCATVSWAVPGLTAGSHYFYAYMDYYGQVAETSETNNIGYHGVIIG